MSDETFEIEQHGKVVTAVLHERDVTHPCMAEVVQSCIEKMRYDNAHDFVVDLSAVDFLASACIGALVELLQEAEHSRGKVALAGCNDNVAFLFKVTKLDAIFEMFEDVEEALGGI